MARMRAPQFTPRVIVSDEDQEAYLCACKHTDNAPFCDGTHARFSDAEVGKEGPGTEERKDEQPAAKATPEEPTVELIHELARDGLAKVGHHGPMAAMGVPRDQLPHWDDIQIMVAQLARKPLHGRCRGRHGTGHRSRSAKSRCSWTSRCSCRT